MTCTLFYCILIVSASCSINQVSLDVKSKEIQYNSGGIYSQIDRKRKRSNSELSIDKFVENKKLKKYSSNIIDQSYSVDMSSNPTKEALELQNSANNKVAKHKVDKFRKRCASLRYKLLECNQKIDRIRHIYKTLKSNMEEDDAREKRDDAKFKDYLAGIPNRNEKLKNEKKIIAGPNSDYIIITID